MPEFSIVMPVYNEADKINATLTQIFSFMRNFTASFELIVVDDGSEDKSVDLIKELAKDNPEVVLIENSHKGKGPTVWTGMKRAKGKYIYMADADLSAPIEELRKLHNWIVEHDYDIVIASREGVGARRIGEPFYRHLMGRVFNLIVQVVALPGIQDSQCGFKLFKKTAGKEVFKRLKIYGEEAKDRNKGYMGAFDVEVLYIAKKLGYKIKELSVTWTFVKTSRLNPLSDSIKMTIDVLKVRLNDFRGYYNLEK